MLSLTELLCILLLVLLLRLLLVLLRLVLLSSVLLPADATGAAAAVLAMVLCVVLGAAAVLDVGGAAPLSPLLLLVTGAHILGPSLLGNFGGGVSSLQG